MNDQTDRDLALGPIIAFLPSSWVAQFLDILALLKLSWIVHGFERARTTSRSLEGLVSIWWVVSAVKNGITAATRVDLVAQSHRYQTHPSYLTRHWEDQFSMMRYDWWCSIPWCNIYDEISSTCWEIQALFQRLHELNTPWSCHRRHCSPSSKPYQTFFSPETFKLILHSSFC